MKSFDLHGTPENRIRLSASEILEAIAEGLDIEITYAVIDGDLDIDKSSAIYRYLKRDERSGNPTLKGNIVINHSEFSGYVSFIYAIFNGIVSFNDTVFRGNVSFRSADFKIYGVAFSNAIFIGNADFINAKFNGDVDFSNANFKGNANLHASTFTGDVFFNNAIFTGNACFSYATFNKNADFSFTCFSGDAEFKFAHFSEDTIFVSASLGTSADFADVIMKFPASFTSVKFSENTLGKMLWNYLLCPLIFLFTIGKVMLKQKTITNFYQFNTEVVMARSTNPYLKRYIDDEQWIKSWRYSSILRRGLFYIWEATSHCGRSFILWMLWSIAIAIVFAFIYQAFGCDSITFNVEDLKGQQPGLKGYIYYSVVTFTTLGFGDIIPRTNWARFAVGTEVVLGYVMLGGLLSIFSNKLARRS